MTLFNTAPKQLTNLHVCYLKFLPKNIKGVQKLMIRDSVFARMRANNNYM